MGGVDLENQLLHSYLIKRKYMNKWYMKLFRRLLNISILNVMIIYRNNMGKRSDKLSFRIQLVEGLSVKYVNVLERKVPGQHSSDNTVPRLTEKHFISRLPPPEKKPRPQRQCVACQKCGKRRDTVYWCNACDIGLCMECFRDYPTKLNF
jgi:ribosomal protein S14